MKHIRIGTVSKLVAPTRYKGLGYIKCGNYWRYVDEETGQVIGYQYPSKAEMLADIEERAETFCSKELR